MSTTVQPAPKAAVSFETNPDAPVPYSVTEAGARVVAAPRSWSFVDRASGERQIYTCMDGCTIDHSQDQASPTSREDIWCWFWDDSLTLPVNENGAPEEFRNLSTVIKVEPWSPNLAERLPYAVVELVDEHYITGLDPDGYETLINTFAARLDRMRETHRHLVEVRAKYMARAQATPTEEVA